MAATDTMHAITVVPGAPGSVQLECLLRPVPGPGELLVQSLVLGICGTDHEILAGAHGQAPPGTQRLVIGHESLGRVVHAPAGSGFTEGDLVVGVVRRPDPLPCRACAGGEWDMCLNGQYTERGIQALDGYGAEFFRLEPAFAIRVDPSLGRLAVLVEPASVLAKAWEHVERIGARTRTWSPRSVLVTGAGPVGLLGALMGCQRGLEVHVLDRAESGVKPELVRALGATYHPASAGLPHGWYPDVVLECTGASPLVLDALGRNDRGGIVCLVGLSSAGRGLPFDAGGFNRTMVLQNDVVFGTVNANRAHYEAAAAALGRADRNWLGRVISRRVPLAQWQDAFEDREGDVKVVIDFDPAGT